MQRDYAYRVLSVAAMLVSVSLLASMGCEGNGPTSTGSTEVSLTEAKITADGQSLGGQTTHQGEQTGTLRYEAHVVDPRGERSPDYRVRVRVQMPGMMGPMHHMSEEFFCYDDGTHGDPIPGDGVYCYEDANHEYGCHRFDAQPGDYYYDFCGVDDHGRESNHMDVMVRLLP